MRRIYIATHGTFASGLADALNLLAGDNNIGAINCYREETPTVDELRELLDKIESNFENDEIIVFTDLFGGSVNNELSTRVMKNKNLHVVAGVNLPLVLDFIFSCGENINDSLNNSIEAAKNSIINVREMINESTLINEEFDEDEIL